MTPQEFYKSLNAHNININETQKNQFDKYYHFLVKMNKKINLTRITSRNDVYLKHFYDSLIMSFFIDKIKYERFNICDVGSGAGFPSIPLKIMFPQLRITIIDSLNKRIIFLRDLINLLSLKDVNLIHDRAENIGHDPLYRSHFDFVTARAVAPLNTLSEICLPFVKKNGYFIALKSNKLNLEINNAIYSINKMGGKISNNYLFKQQDIGIRYILFIKKNNPTPDKYPRKAGLPKRDPLILK